MSAGEISPAGTLATAPLVAIQAPTLPRRLSLRSNFAWAVCGNAVYAICQWGMIVALAKLGSALMVGQFSLGLAIVTPVFMLSNLDLRAVQATDARRQFRFSAISALADRSDSRRPVGNRRHRVVWAVRSPDGRA